MDSGPLIVLAPDLPRVDLLVEVKWHLAPGPLSRMEAQLKRAMRQRGCAAGLLVSLEETHFYEDRYLTRAEDSVERVGTVPTSALLPPELTPGTEMELRSAVHAWLEHLCTAYPSALPQPEEARKLVEKYLLPAVAGGRLSPA